MACFRDESWVSIPMILSDRLSLGGQNNQGDDDNEKMKSDRNSVAFGFEKVFPVYAWGIKSTPDFDFSLVSTLTNSGDSIWSSIREEAKMETEKEPILSSFLYASILSHDCLEQALAFVLANRLQNPTLSATQLMDMFCDMMVNDKGIQRSIRLDVQAFKERDPACLSYSSALLYMKGYHSLQVHRVAHALWSKGRKIMALALQSRISEVFGIDIHPAAKIGDGILLDHGTGLVIGETAVVGNRVSLMQGVTLGGTGKEIGDRHPKVGDGALIAARSTILGNIKIGEGAMVAAGSLVLKDIPPRSMVVGIPATVFGYVNELDPSLTMKHDDLWHGDSDDVIWCVVSQLQKMLLDENSIDKTHYEILNVKEDASYDEIRASYRTALLNSHPDKMLISSETFDCDQELVGRFLKVKKAWEVLSDASSRAVYDRELRGSRQDDTIAEAAEDLCLDDMMAEDVGKAMELFYQCRCGDHFCIDSLELGQMGYLVSMDGTKISVQAQDTLPATVLLPCGSCSLKARLLINSDCTISGNKHL